MHRTLQGLDDEWAKLVASPDAAAALTRWRAEFPALGGVDDLDALLLRRRDPAEAPGIMKALARLAPDDAVAARVLLQALMPGLCRLAATIAPGDASAIDELVAIAWVRIRTYPAASRRGSVPANVLWDVRKSYQRHHRGPDQPRGLDPGGETGPERGFPVEEAALDTAFIEELAAQVERHGIISADMFWVIVRTRIEGRTLAEVAAEIGSSEDSVQHRRLRAERQLRLRLLPLAS